MSIMFLALSMASFGLPVAKSLTIEPVAIKINPTAAIFSVGKSLAVSSRFFRFSEIDSRGDILFSLLVEVDLMCVNDFLC